MSPRISVGDRVHARWRGNGCYYQATIVELNNLEGAQASAIVDWDDGDVSDRVVDVRDVSKVADESAPYPPELIDKCSIVKELPFKGRCLFCTKAVSPGDVIFIEKPTLVATPTKNQALWDLLKEMHEKENFTLGTTTFHYASLLSVLTLGEKEMQVIIDKFVPDGENEVIGSDIERIVKVVREKGFLKGGFPNQIKELTPKLLQCLVNAWRYNSFGHHTEEGLVLYNRISMCAHGCDPTCCWTYGDEDSFVLRARVFLHAEQELTISYLQDDDLLKSTDVRRQKLENWKFTCGCSRCLVKIDNARGYRCLKCRAGAHYYIENIDIDGVRLTNCDVCGEKAQDAEVEQCLTLEPEYIARIEALDKTNIADVEIVYNATLDFFHENHWCVFAMDHILWEYYRDKDANIAVLHQEKKILYHSRVYPRPTFVWAWAMEELADNLKKLYTGVRASRLSEVVNLYRKAQCQLAILCGPGHPYTIAPQEKWYDVNQLITSTLNDGVTMDES